MNSEVSPRTKRREQEEQFLSMLSGLFESTRDRMFHGQIRLTIPIKAGLLGDVEQEMKQSHRFD